MTKQEIKAGQVWESRAGQRFPIDQVLDDHGTTPVRSGEMYWQKNGRYWSDKIKHRYDLVKLIE